MIFSIAVWNTPNSTSLGVWLKVIEGPHVLTDENAELLWSKVISPGFSPKGRCFDPVVAITKSSIVKRRCAMSLSSRFKQSAITFLPGNQSENNSILQT